MQLDNNQFLDIQTNTSNQIVALLFFLFLEKVTDQPPVVGGED